MNNISIVTKKLCDKIGAGIGLLILSPLFLGCAFAIKVDSPGPVFFKQDRLGLNGKIYKMYKFRSMIVNAEKIGTGLFNYADDPRVTKVGRWLRDTSIDELPQLLNVFLGDMSLVGPRPAVSYELGDYSTLNKRYKKRFNVLPGITGLAQVSGRNDIPWDDKVNLDNQYIDLFNQRGFIVDIEILVKTVINVFKSKNIYEEKLDSGMSDTQSAELAEAEIITKAHALEPEDFEDFEDDEGNDRYEYNN